MALAEPELAPWSEPRPPEEEPLGRQEVGRTLSPTPVDHSQSWRLRGTRPTLGGGPQSGRRVEDGELGVKENPSCLVCTSFLKLARGLWSSYFLSSDTDH